MKKISLIVIITFIALSNIDRISAQSSGAYYKIEGIPGELTKTVNLWGYIQRPGRYEVPISTNLIQLITYAGGPREYAVLDEIQLYRVEEDGSRKLIEVDIEDPEETTEADLIVYSEDTILVEFSSIVSWREVFSTISGPLAIVASLAIIIDRLVN